MTLHEEQFDTLLRICGRVLDLDGPVQPDTPILAAGVDSLGIVSLIAEIEGAFSVRLPLELLSLKTLMTPASIWEALRMASPR